MRRSTLISSAGTVILVVGAALLLGPWLEASRWRSSPIAAQAERNAVAPLVVPPRATPVPAARPTAIPTETSVQQSTPAPIGVAGPRRTEPAPPAVAPDNQVPPTSDPAPAAPPTPTLGPSNLQLGDVAFQFLDPPQPGATALLTLAIRNPTDAPSGPVSVDLPLAWMNGYTLEGVVPLPIDGRLTGEHVDNNLRLTVDGPAPGDVLDVSVFVVTTDEVIDAPTVRAVDAAGREIGKAHPPTEAPRPAPGPVYAIDIPSLHLHAGVVQVDWEPPLFVVGQVRGSAFVTQGNSVLVGHLRGAAGYNVFDHLDRVSVGDPIVASSRGADYPFVVTHIEVLPADDTTPTQATDSPRLTLMTCTGVFNPLTGEYSERLWVIAEPTDVVAARPTPPAATVQVAAPGGLGNADADLVAAFGAPVGESRSKLAVYRRAGIEHNAQLLDVPGTSARRAVMVVERSPQNTPFSTDEAARRARALLPKDAVARSLRADGNSRFAVEYFSSAALERTLPPEWFTDRNAQPGELVVVYKRLNDGRVTDVLVGIGSDPMALLTVLD